MMAVTVRSLGFLQGLEQLPKRPVPEGGEDRYGRAEQGRCHEYLHLRPPYTLVVHASFSHVGFDTGVRGQWKIGGRMPNEFTDE